MFTGSHEPTQGSPACSVHARGPHHSSHGSPTCGVHATGSTSVKARSTCVEPTRNGAHTNQSTDYPRAAQGCECSIPWGTKFLHKSRNSSDFRTWSESIPKTRRNFGLDGSQFRKHVGLADLMGVNSENTSEYRNSGCKKSKFRIISFFRLFSRSTKLSRP